MSKAACWDDTAVQSLGAWHRVSDDALYANIEPIWPQEPRVPKWRFQRAGVVVESRVPLEVTLRREGDVVYAESERLHIFASGHSVDSAVEDFAHQLVHFFEYYTRLGNDEVVGLAAELRQMYVNDFEKTVTNAA